MRLRWTIGLHAFVSKNAHVCVRVCVWNETYYLPVHNALDILFLRAPLACCRVARTANAEPSSVRFIGYEHVSKHVYLILLFAQSLVGGGSTSVSKCSLIRCSTNLIESLDVRNFTSPGVVASLQLTDQRVAETQP